MIRLWLDGYLVDKVQSNFSLSLKGNILSNFNSREVNHTNSFKILRTSKNRGILEGLGIVGSTSRKPYKRVNATIDINGVCIARNYVAEIKSATETHYTLVLKDEVLHFIKKIENKKLSVLDYSEVNHTKTLGQINTCWLGDLPFSYLVADYGGQNNNNDSRLNIDYQIPSIKVSWLWEKMFEYTNTIYSGSVFNLEEWNDLFLTFPEQTRTEIEPEDVLNVSAVNGYNKTYFLNQKYIQFNALQIDFINTEYFTYKPIDESVYIDDNFNYVNGILKATRFKCNKTSTYTFTFDEHNWLNESSEGKFAIWVNPNNGNYATSEPVHTTQTDPITLDIQQGDEVYIGMIKTNFDVHEGLNTVDVFDDISFVIQKGSNPQISFDSQLAKFGIKDFFKEVIWHFGLTMTKKADNHYEFSTWKEILKSESKNYSSKFVNKIDERYRLGSFAQENNFRYKYEDKESNHFDSNFLIDNYNIPEKKDVIKSKLFAPSEQQEVIKIGDIDISSNTFYNWINDAREEENEPPKFKQLSSRFHFIRKSEQVGVFEIYNNLGESLEVHKYHLGTFRNLSWSNRINNYYSILDMVLNDCKVSTFELKLNLTDVISFDFNRPYYFKQLQAHYLPQSIASWKPNTITKVSFIKINNNAIDFDYENTSNDCIELLDFELNGYVLSFEYKLNVTQISFVAINIMKQGANGYSQIVTTQVSDNTGTITLFTDGVYTFSLSVLSDLCTTNNTTEMQTITILNNPQFVLDDIQKFYAVEGDLSGLKSVVKFRISQSIYFNQITLKYKDENDNLAIYNLDLSRLEYIQTQNGMKTYEYYINDSFGIIQEQNEITDGEYECQLLALNNNNVVMTSNFLYNIKL